MTPLENHRPIDREYRRLLDLIIGGMAELTSSRLSGDDSPYVNPWLEYAAQIQGQHGSAYRLYEDLLNRLCDAEASDLSDPQVRFLWNGTQDREDWTEDGTPSLDLQREHVSDELFRRLQCEAANEELPR
jgi:DNA phosphorothioation-dependent restriction protein DptG